MNKNTVIIGLLVLAIIAVAGLKNSKKNVARPAVEQTSQTALPTLLELGSVTCVPCKMMTPIIDELRETFIGQLEVKFIDVWQDEAASDTYEINTIPTQIFFDAEGVELFRHEGFYPREDIIAKWNELGYEFAERHEQN